MLKKKRSTAAVAPAPWSVVKEEVGGSTDPEWWVYSNGAPIGERLVATCRNRDNARLIGAAPELLIELVDFHDHAIDQGWHECDGIPGGCPVLAALAKARGT